MVVVVMFVMFFSGQSGGEINGSDPEKALKGMIS